MNYDYFELQRKSDDLIYQFDKKDFKEWIPWYCRRDQDLWITYRKNLGWVAFDEEKHIVLWIPWQVNIENQIPSHPPEGEWVSKKWHKSYVYDLVFPKN